MDKKRLSLSSSVFSDRVRKFDTYLHNPKHSVRATKQLHQPGQQPTKVSLVLSRKIRPTRLSPKATPPSLVKSAECIPGTHKLALQAVGNTQDFGSVSLSDQFRSMYSTAKVARSKLNSAMYILAAVIFTFSVFVSVQTLLTNNQVDKVLGEETPLLVKDEQGVLEGTGWQPAESKIPEQAISSYTVSSPELPRYLRVPELGIESRIKPLGENAKGEVDAPWNINDVGWYTGSTRPGNPNGSSLLLGHVSGWSGPGVFKKIDTLKPGTRFEVEKGSGEKVTYQVTRLESIPLENVNMGKILAMEVPGEHDLKLMTCSGKYNFDNGTYTERTVVYAKVIR